MGDISEMMLEGILDEYTGEYIGPAVGYPRSRDPQHPSNKDKFKRKGYNPYNYHGCLSKKDRHHMGVYKWISLQSLSGAPKNTAWIKTEQAIVQRYGKEVLNMEGKIHKIAQHISKTCWPEFMKWVKETYK